MCVCDPPVTLLNTYTLYRHFDLNKLWVEDREFTAGVYVTVVNVMQVQY